MVSTKNWNRFILLQGNYGMVIPMFPLEMYSGSGLRNMLSKHVSHAQISKPDGDITSKMPAMRGYIGT